MSAVRRANTTGRGASAVAYLAGVLACGSEPTPPPVAPPDVPPAQPALPITGSAGK